MIYDVNLLRSDIFLKIISLNVQNITLMSILSKVLILEFCNECGNGTLKKDLTKELFYIEIYGMSIKL